MIEEIFGCGGVPKSFYFSLFTFLTLKYAWYRSHTDVNLIPSNAFRQQQQLQQQDQTPKLHDKPTLTSGTPQADPGTVYLNLSPILKYLSFWPLCCALFPNFHLPASPAAIQTMYHSYYNFFGSEGKDCFLEKRVLLWMSLSCFKVKGVTIRPFDFWLCFCCFVYYLLQTDCCGWKARCKYPMILKNKNKTNFWSGKQVGVDEKNEECI